MIFFRHTFGVGIFRVVLPHAFTSLTTKKGILRSVRDGHGGVCLCGQIVDRAHDESGDVGELQVLARAVGKVLVRLRAGGGGSLGRSADG